MTLESAPSPQVAPASGTNIEWDGSQYTAINGLQRWVAERSLSAVALAGDERLLDVGCGDGGITAELAARIPRGRALGIDPSPRMIEVAKSRIAGGSGNLAFELGDVQTMRFAADFDALVSFNALHWVADHPRALRHVRAALVDGGLVLLQLVCAGDRQSVEQTAMQVCGRSTWREWFTTFVPPFHHPDPDAFTGQARDAGLTVTSAAVDDLSWDFGSAAGFLAWCRAGFAPWLSRLPDEAARTAFMTELGACYAQVVGSDQLVRFLQLTVRLRAE